MKITHIHSVSVTEKPQDVDPVCGMEVKPDSPYQMQYEGRMYYFCSEHCLHKFKAHPEQYLSHPLI